MTTRFLRLSLIEPTQTSDCPLQALGVLEANLETSIPSVKDFKVMLGSHLVDSLETLWDHSLLDTYLCHDYEASSALSLIRVRWLGLPLRSSNSHALYFGDVVSRFGPQFNSMEVLADAVGLPLDSAYRMGQPNRAGLLRYLLSCVAVKLLSLPTGREKLSAFLLDLALGNGLTGEDQVTGQAFAEQALDQVKFVRWRPPIDFGRIEF
ncbi:hypothetical protein ACFSM5_07865 [Lacibacterium aquatile]|uniref:Uncharacterized protein n=1 Tax=Lacibacterium aquatile TaxID=1168082 RepID=A0ABW5DS79_9PROT